MKTQKIKKIVPCPQVCCISISIDYGDNKRIFRLPIRSVFSNKMTLCKDFVLFCFEGGHFLIIIIARTTWLFDLCLTFS